MSTASATLFLASWKGAFFVRGRCTTRCSVPVVRGDSSAYLAEVLDLGEPIDDQLLDQWAAHGDLVELLKQLIVAFASSVLG
jgi:hypothetical protein